MPPKKPTFAKAPAKEKAERAVQDSGKRDKREAEARELAASIERGPGPPPFWILDCAAKLRDTQCKTIVRERAARKLQEGMEEAALYVAYFAGALSCAIIGDFDEDVRLAAVDTLGALGEAGVPYTDALTAAAQRDKCAEVRCAAARSLGLVCRSPQKRAAVEMCQFVFALRKEDAEPIEKDVMEQILAAFGTATRKNLPLLKKLMSQQCDDASKEDRKDAAEKLCHSVMCDCDEAVILTASEAFGTYMVEALPVLQTFCKSFLYKSDRTRLQKALDTLTPVAMEDPVDDVRQSATHTLSELNFSTEPMFAALASTLEGNSEPVQRLRSAEAFGRFVKISDRMAAETLHSQGHALASAAMNDTNPGVRAAAARALGTSVTAAGPYVEDLVASLKKDDVAVRKGAARALGAIGEAALPRINDLFRAALLDSDFNVRYWAAESLGQLGASAVTYTNVFAAMALYDVDKTMQARCNDALQAVGKLAGDIIDEYTVVKEEEEEARQERAAKYLDEVGVPYSGQVVKEGSGKKQGRRSIKGQGKKKVEEETDPRQVNRDFACDVGAFLRRLQEEAEGKLAPGEDHECEAPAASQEKQTASKESREASKESQTPSKDSRTASKKSRTPSKGTRKASKVSSPKSEKL